ncbi:replication protein RepA [Teichococcus aestuarii]
MEPVGVPFGAYARLIMLYLQTQALRTGSREVELGGSWRAWMHRIGVPWGGSSGKAVREQAEMIARCRLTFHVQGMGRSGLVNQSIVDAADFIEEMSDDRQGRLSLETAKLSESFFAQLQKHPVPLEESAIRPLANNSAALDVLVWLSYRLHSLQVPRLVTWRALKAQFGTSYKELYHFKARFPDLLRLALAVYPDAQVEVQDEGVLLKPSRPPVSPKLIQIG